MEQENNMIKLIMVKRKFNQKIIKITKIKMIGKINRSKNIRKSVFTILQK